MGFWESVIAKISLAIADRVMDRVEKRITEIQSDIADNARIYEKYDAKKNEMIEELAQAHTQEERDAILTKIYNSRPVFK